MSAERLRVSEILDDAAEAAMRVAAPWMGLLWLCSLPLRLLQVHFVARSTWKITYDCVYGHNLRASVPKGDVKAARAMLSKAIESMGVRRNKK